MVNMPDFSEDKFASFTFVIDSFISTNRSMTQLTKYYCSHDINLDSVKPSKKL